MSRQKLLILISLKLIMLNVVARFPYAKLSTLAFAGTDTTSYTFPALSSLTNLEWSRMPGYSVLITIAHWLSNTYKYDLICLWQVLVSILTIIIITKTLKNHMSAKWVFTVGVLLALSPHLAHYDLKILSESLSTNLLVIATCLLLLAKENKFYYFLSGLMLTASFSIRPTAIVLLPLSFVFMVIFSKGGVKTAIYLIASLFVFEAFWIPFNYKRYGEVIFLTKTPLYSHYYDNAITYFLDLAGTYGGKGKENFLLEPEVEKITFNLPPFIHKSWDAPYEVKDFYTSKFNPSTVKVLDEKLKNCETCFGKSETNLASWESEKIKRELIFAEIKSMASSVKKEHFIKANLTSKLIPLSLFISQNLDMKEYRGEPVFHYFEPRNLLDILTRQYWNIFYSLMLIFGVLGMLTALFSKNKNWIYLSIVGGTFLLIYPLLFRLSEWRYMHNAIPFLIIFSVYAVNKIASVLKLSNQKAD